MKKLMYLIISVVFTLNAYACSPDEGSSPEEIEIETPNTSDNNGNSNENDMKIKIIVGSTVLTATLIDNSTARALVAKFPLTVPMQDLYNREMCYHFPDVLPADNVQNTGYEVGEIIYWPPLHSLVIMYAQNGEHFSMQKIGRIESGVDIFAKTGNVTVTFEVLK
ncbi:hypothetical protein EZS27_018429 [termite gut metagenome]|uniref:Cyclophilin-like domain-containing protein n=1 Tax=termite gut metagenome TaxID=433724 RepID=A0A5J4RJ51_9ZZZZ